MSGRTTVLVIVLSLGSLVSSSAQNGSSQDDRLKKLLQEQFSPPQPPRQGGPTIRKFDWIAPKSDRQPAPKSPNDNGYVDRPYRFVVNTLGNPRFASDAEAGGALRSAQVDHPFRSPILAQQAVPAIGHNSYVVVLKPDANAAQIRSLLQKYNLKITKTVPGLHLLRVERDDDDDPSSATGPTTPAQGREGLARILNPPIVQHLRHEPIVDSAFVESALSTKSVPKAKNTSVVNKGITYNWHWRDGLGAAPRPSPGVEPVPPPSTGSVSSPAPVPNSGAANPPSSSPIQPRDGNWGLKVMRLPPVWTIIQRYRVAQPKLPKPKLAILDTGFFPHEDLNFNALRSPDGVSAPNVAATSSVTGNLCDLAHGNHVAGIAGAVWGNKVGIDGVIPQAKIDAVPFTVAYGVDSSNPDNADVARAEHLNMFVDIANDLSDYLDDSTQNADGLRVINLSLGYNFVSSGILEGNPDDIPELSTLIQDEAKQFAHLMKRYESSVLFVVSAGNDSAGRAAPIDAKWASSIAWAATQTPASARPNNVLVVEAVDRDGLRADFSNTGGHVSAPGVNVLSTLATGDSAYGVCSGTSQAAPHVAALATLLFELDPTKKATVIADIIKSSAVKQASGPGAPRVDALEAVLKLSPSNLTRLADLNGDGKVDIHDMEIFLKHLTELNNNRTKATPFTEDLNGDGVVDDNECSWPQIDLNGSGTASLSNADARPVQGAMRTDIQVMQLAWTDKKQTFDKALRQTGLDAVIKAANDSSTVASVPGKGCR
ncbi:MAG: S8 family serine peptidase [Bradyrhizobiaceae bacterium]|nr:S8 family serine peptidase [Bradyrhizobiaceae bacterium]